MKRTIGSKWILTMLLMAITPIAVSAQKAVFHAAPAQAPAKSSQQAPATPARGTFGIAPWAAAQAPEPAVPSLVPNFPTVLVPDHILAPGQTVVTAPVVNAGPTVAVPGNANAGVSGIRHMPPLGMSRGEVVREFGAPAVTVATRSGETLYFTGGVTVTIQNGQVAGAR